MLKRFVFLVFWWVSVVGEAVVNHSWKSTSLGVFFLVLGFVLSIGCFFIPISSFWLASLLSALTYLAVGALAHLLFEQGKGCSPIFE